MECYDNVQYLTIIAKLNPKWAIDYWNVGYDIIKTAQNSVR